MQITAYLGNRKETMRELGKACGLQGEALHKFMYALYEVAITMEVNEVTGDAIIIAVDGKLLAGRDRE